MSKEQIILAIAEFDKLRLSGVLFRKAMKMVLESTGVDLRKINFTEYRTTQG